ncbi:MAG: 2,3-bisphosphoglycerate-independent phosphoglycerate mutase [Halieaceae bacterium]|jgi:2,3-bisphosphoglycerate-independent phosphoglycerate mutase
MTNLGQKPVVLTILDGWGHREASEDNAIHHAHTPNWDHLWQSAPHTVISASGLDVGLPEGQMGNSEVGHMCLGSGRVIHQSITRIDQAIADGTFAENPAYLSAIDEAVGNGTAVHLFGLLSAGGIHSHEQHILAIIKLAYARGARRIFLHAFLDGRDTPPRSAQPSLQLMMEKFEQLGCGRVASITGRYYAMDRDSRWERIEPVYGMLTNGQAEYRAVDALTGLDRAYLRDENDEFVRPTIIAADNDEDGRVGDGDVVLFMNFRADRARQLTQCFIDDQFDGFVRHHRPRLAQFVCTTEYSAAFGTPCAFPPTKMDNVLGAYVSDLGLTQLRIAETEKYAHVTFFFSGGREALFPGEERILIQSPDVATYDLQPEMNAYQLTDRLVEAIHSGKFSFIICNYANGDMVGHTGIFDAAVAAVEALDVCIGRVTAAVAEAGGQLLITADHGNCEQMMDHQSGQLHTQHTTELVPLVYVGPRELTLRGGGKLADIAPTLLHLAGLAQPTEMTGTNLAESR